MRMLFYAQYMTSTVQAVRVTKKRNLLHVLLLTFTVKIMPRVQALFENSIYVYIHYTHNVTTVCTS